MPSFWQIRFPSIQMFLIFHNEKNNQITVKQTDFPINESAMQSYFAMRFVLFVVSRPPTVKPKNTKWRWRFWRKAVDWRLTRAAVFESPDDFLSVLRQLSNRLVKDPRHGFWRKRNSGFGNSPLPCHQNGRRRVFIHRSVIVRIAVFGEERQKDYGVLCFWVIIFNRVRTKARCCAATLFVSPVSNIRL